MRGPPATQANEQRIKVEIRSSVDLIIYVGLLSCYIGYQFQISFVLHHVVSRYCYPFRGVGNLVFLYDNLILIVNSFYIVLIIFISIMSHLLWHTCELAGEIFLFN